MIVTVGDVTLDLTDAQVENLRRQLAVNTIGTEWLTAAEVARRLGVSREYVYRHKKDLGGEPLPGDGPRPRWRFDPAKIEAGTPKAPERKPTPKPRKQTPKGQAVPLLAVRGEGPYAGPANKAAPGGAVTPTEGLTKGGGSSNGCE